MSQPDDVMETRQSRNTWEDAACGGGENVQDERGKVEAAEVKCQNDGEKGDTHANSCRETATYQTQQYED